MASSNPRDEYEEAFALKFQGNDAFKREDYQTALRHYSQMIVPLGMQPQRQLWQAPNSQATATDPFRHGKRTALQKKTDQLRVDAFNNMAAVYVKLGNMERVIEKTSYVLRLQHSSKALFRRGHAYRKIGNLHAAKRDLEAAVQSQQFGDVDQALCRELKLVLTEMESLAAAPSK